MRTLIVGSGPTGLILGAALARRGHTVISVDRDPGPTAGGWVRRGVMQFEHAHGFRPQVSMTLQEVWPEALHEWLSLGATPVEVPSSPQVVGVLSRRSTFERALRHAACERPGLALRTGHVDGLVLDHGHVVGARVGGSVIAADLVVDASGRAGRLGRTTARDAGAELEGDCGMVYVDRTYKLRPGAEPGPMTSPIAYVADFDGYQCLVFLHESGHFSVVVVRPTADTALKELRFGAAFEAACRAIPALAEWTDPARAHPTSEVLVGGALRNVYRRQGDTPGLVAVGDSVATTTPTRGRGIAMSCMQVTALLAILDEGADASTVVEPFGAWCDRNIEPWVADHIAIDGGMVRRWEGQDVDLSLELTTDLIADAADADSRIGRYAAGYLAMTALPETVRPAEPLARAVYQRGWRPAYAPGPSRDDLVGIIRGAVSAA
jgi:2-polyprenyl-6-methoxyphenol hydroxylase-like FAD-dependent oxidoreductase